MPEEKKDPRPPKGSVVKLKSGGVSMVVSHLFEGDEEDVKCRWMDTIGHHQEGRFPYWVLEMVLPAHPYR